LQQEGKAMNNAESPNSKGVGGYPRGPERRAVLGKGDCGRKTEKRKVEKRRSISSGNEGISGGR